MSYLIDNKQIDIMKEDWKYLVILDAARYDYFKEIYKEILGDVGCLKKAESSSLDTVRWQKETLKNCEDIVYINTIII